MTDKERENKSELPGDYGMNPGLPVQQVETDSYYPTNKEVAAATKELNPNKDSRSHRG